MLYKPTSVSPHRDMVNPSGDIHFQCTALSGAQDVSARLMISDGSYEYYFTSGSLPPSITYDNYGVNVDFTYMNSSRCAYEIRTSDAKRMTSTSDDGYKSLNIVSGRSYTWQMRLYEATASTWIGYGTVESVDVNNRILKIRPHTNIHFSGATGGTSYPQLWSRYDSNANYYIKTSSGSYRIEDYKFYNPSSSFNASNDLTYDTPKQGYAKVSSVANISVGDTYTIYCNYIDTDVYYFEASTPPQVVLSEYFDNNGKPVSRTIASDTLTINYSNLNIHGQYSQDNGASVNYYSFLLEQYTGVDDSDNREYTVVDYTNNIYSPVIEYSYDRFLGENEYRLTLSLTDTFGVTITKVINIIVDYMLSVYPMQLRVEPYYKHNSLILDYSELHSISGKEKEGGAHQYVAIDTQTGRKNNDILAERNACHVDYGNSITYDWIDGEAALYYKNAVYSFILTIDYEHNDIVVSGIDDDNIGFDISWDGVYFTITYAQNHSILAVKYFSPYSSWLAQYNN